MLPFTIVVLICAMAVDHAACQPDTAADIVQGPQVPNEIMCGLYAEAMLATTAIVPRPGEEYSKIVCLRTKAKEKSDTPS